ncbi:MAG: DUF1836 domain-containing protein [Bacilli bacterium]|nr:DUF1836 domain-containing protein [Bacilli bacterium]
MNDSISEIKKWLEGLSNFSLPEWEKLPDLDLYMDQVVTYLEKQLALLSDDSEEKLVSTSMINNYVKANLIPSPIQKKYSKEHIAHILAVCTVKQVLPINKIGQMLEIVKCQDFNYENIYTQFAHSQAKEIGLISKESLKRIDYVTDKNTEPDKIKSLILQYAFKLALDAQVKKTIASRLLKAMTKPDEENGEALKKEKKKEK